MPRPDERDRRRPHGDANANARDAAAGEDLPPSKTRRKAEMHALQDMGEILVGLDSKRLAMLSEEAALPPRLVEAILEARSITAWGARKRQLQYAGSCAMSIPGQSGAASICGRTVTPSTRPTSTRSSNGVTGSSRNRRRSISLRRPDRGSTVRAFVR